MVTVYLISLIYCPIVITALVINEVHGDPADGSEWVELFNEASEAQDLTNWLLDDEQYAASLIAELDVTGIVSGALPFTLRDLLILGASYHILHQVSKDREE